MVTTPFPAGLVGRASASTRLHDDGSSVTGRSHHTHSGSQPALATACAVTTPQPHTPAPAAMTPADASSAHSDSIAPISRTLVDLLSRMTDRLREMLEARGCAIFLASADGLHPVARSGALAATGPLPGSELVLIEPSTASGSGAGVAIPIPGSTESLGLLLVSTASAQRLSEMDRDVTAVAARLAGIAIEQDRAGTPRPLTWRQIELALDLHGDALLVRNGDGGVVHVNAAARELLGLGANEPTARIELTRLIRALDLRDQRGQRIRPSMLPYARALAGLPTQDLVVSCRTTTAGERCWLLLQAQAITDASGRLALVLTSLRDFVALQRHDAAQRLRAAIAHHLRERPVNLAAIEREIGGYIDGGCSIALSTTEAAPPAHRPRIGSCGLEDRGCRRAGRSDDCEASAELSLLCGHMHHSGPVTTWRTRPPEAPIHVAVVPIEGDGSRLGTITCRRSAHQPCFEAEEVALLRELAVQIGLATTVDRLRETLDADERRIVDISQLVQDVEEVERRRMALSIHDGLAQVAASVCQQLEIVAHRFAPSCDEESAEMARALSLAQRTVEEARMLIAGLRPVTLDQQGLTAAVLEEIQRMRADGWSVRYIDGVSDRRYDDDIELNLFRIVQEALANIRKHAGAVPVEVVLEQSSDAVHVEVRDDGPGFEPHRISCTSSEHVGLQGMSERIGRLGGTIAITSEPGRGTRVIATVPLEAAAPRG